MIKFINKRTKSPMWVADNRAEEYKAAGHKLAASPVAVKPIEQEEVKEETTKEVKEVVKKAPRSRKK